MNPESLHALLIDRELGELPSEAAELLEAWLAEHPESAAAVPSVRQTLETASAAVRRFPELARPEPSVVAFPAARFQWLPLALAASVMILIGGAAWLGFHAGQASTQQAVVETDHETALAPRANTFKNSGPWARYAFVSNPRGGLTVVRRDRNSQP
jgi:ferric-dicitrate binding protein FerR (iron transport regulator)